MYCIRCEEERGVDFSGVSCGDWVDYRLRCSVCRKHMGDLRLPKCIYCGAGVYKKSIYKVVEGDSVACRECASTENLEVCSA